RNFGISGFDTFAGLGINAKNSEFHAAMGLVNLRHMEKIHLKQKEITEGYNKKLANLKAYKPKWHNAATENFAYFPIILESEDLLLKIKTGLDTHGIFTRRYFYPSLANALPYVDKLDMETTDSVS